MPASARFPLVVRRSQGPFDAVVAADGLRSDVRSECEAACKQGRRGMQRFHASESLTVLT